MAVLHVFILLSLFYQIVKHMEQQLGLPFFVLFFFFSIWILTQSEKIIMQKMEWEVFHLEAVSKARSPFFAYGSG